MGLLSAKKNETHQEDLDCRSRRPIQKAQSMLVSVIFSFVQERVFEQGPPVKARICIGQENVIMECDADKNTFGSLYHVKEPRTKLHDLPLSAALQHLRQWNDRGIMIKARQQSSFKFCFASIMQERRYKRLFSLPC